LARAVQTCELAGYGDVAQLTGHLEEWDYGSYEGLRTPEIQEERPGWSLWRDGVPDGETVAEVGDRAREVIARAVSVDGDVALFAHGHLLRILTACWLGLPPDGGRLLALGTASVSVLGFEHDARVIVKWNQDSHLVDVRPR
jgi:probable phosphoglycerate mutase